MAGAKLFGARVKRVEDRRFLCGRAQYTDDVHAAGALHVAFVRSPHAHARISAIDMETARKLPGVHRIFAGADIEGVLKPLGLPFLPEVLPPAIYKPCKWPCLAIGEVRYVGEPVAAVLGESRYIAEDGAGLVEVDYEVLPAVIDPEAAMAPGAPLVHAELGSNVAIHLVHDGPGVEAALAAAAVVVHETFRTNRHSAMPLEGRATLATINGDGDITLWTSTQMPHAVRSRVAELMGFPEQKLQVIAPDVGGGFGLKAGVCAEDVLTCHFARTLNRAVKWTEDRREHFLGSFHAKDDIVECEMGFAADGRIVGMRARIIGDLGTYSADPWPSPMEPLMVGPALPGPYRVPAYAYETFGVYTNKTTLSTYRGVGLPVAVLVQEHLMDLAARRLNLDPAEIRRRNLIRPEEFPYESVTGLTYDSSSSTDALEKGLQMIGYDEFRRRQQEARGRGQYLGIGICTYIEMTTYGTQFFVPFGNQNSSYEGANIRMDPSGGVVLSVGTHSHGQGHHTTYGQLLADELGVRLEDVNFVQGDTKATPYGWGSWGSRSAVAGGGTVILAARKLKEKMLRIAGHLLEASPEDLELVPGKVQVKGVPTKMVTIKEIARAAVFSAWKLPAGEEPGLEVTQYYDPPPVTFTNATHIAEVEVDVDTGVVRIIRYVVVEDCGKMINPMIVDAQVAGGVVQGIGGVLLEHLQYDESGQLLTTTLMDYLVPTAADVPDFEIGHIETPSPLTIGGIKGMGEGGTIGGPAAIVNAVADALAPFGAKVTQLPLTPERVWHLAHP